MQHLQIQAISLKVQLLKELNFEYCCIQALKVKEKVWSIVIKLALLVALGIKPEVLWNLSFLKLVNGLYPSQEQWCSLPHSLQLCFLTLGKVDLWNK